MTQATNLAPAATSPVRNRRLLFSMLTGAVSKIPALVIQVVALPLALHSLGTERYAAFLALTSALSWISLSGLGFAPSMPRLLTQAIAANDVREQRNIIVSAMVFTAGMALTLFVALVVLSVALPPEALIGIHGIPNRELQAAYVAVAGLSCLQLLTALVPAIRSGYQELHLTYTWTAAANIVAIGALFAIANSKSPTIALFFLALFGPLVVAMFLDSALFSWQRPKVIAGPTTIAQTLRRLIPHTSNALAGQVSFFLVACLPTALIAHIRGAHSAAVLGSLLQAMLTGISVMQIVFQPLVPAIANAYAHNDLSWMRKSYFRVALVVVCVAVLTLVVTTIAGPELVRFWLHKDLGISHTLMALAGSYFALWMWSVFHFFVLASTGRLAGAAKIYLLEGVLTTAFGVVLAYFFDSEGMFAGMVVASVVTTAWFLPSRTWPLLWPRAR